MLVRKSPIFRTSTVITMKCSQAFLRVMCFRRCILLIAATFWHPLERDGCTRLSLTSGGDPLLRSRRAISSEIVLWGLFSAESRWIDLVQSWWNGLEAVSVHYDL